MIQPLPELNCRWTATRKAQLVMAVKNGLLTEKDLKEKYAMSSDEFLSMEKSINMFGVHGLRTTLIQEYRRAINDAA